MTHKLTESVTEQKMQVCMVLTLVTLWSIIPTFPWVDIIRRWQGWIQDFPGTTTYYLAKWRLGGACQKVHCRSATGWITPKVENQQLSYTIYHCADLRGAPGTRAPRRVHRFLSFSCSFRQKKMQNNSEFGSWRTPWGKSWIRHSLLSWKLCASPTPTY